MSDTPEKKDFIREIIAEDLASGKHATTITRFPPEPNGYLHIGHAKAICLSFGIAQENAATGAKCHLRFDDTNPSKEEVEYVESIKEDVKWLGFDWGENLYFASDYFEFFYDCAVGLIQKGLAYVEDDSVEEVRAKRGNVTTPGTRSASAERSVEENLDLFARMRAGEFKDGEKILRAKIDMSSSNMHMRDPVLYRIMHSHHHNTGDAWCIYPMYDFAHPLEDALEHITHSLCTLEFEDHRPLYDWFIENCPVPSKPRQIEFSRLNLNYTVMSKRKLLQLVQEKHVAGWDDPRMPTISGMRRRGYPAAALRDFVVGTGITKFKGITDVAVLEHTVRDHLNHSAPRRMAVLDPVKVVLENWNEQPLGTASVSNHPQNPEMGERQVPISNEVWIEREDFMEDPPNKFFRLGPDRYVRLKGGHIIQCTGYDKDADRRVSLIKAKILPDTVGQDAPEGVKCKAAIHWVDVATGLDAEVRLYDRLFNCEDPDGAEGGFLSVINPDSLSITTAKVEPVLADCEAGFSCQFERMGYFVADSKDHQPGKPVFNRTVALKDSWGKQGGGRLSTLMTLILYFVLCISSLAACAAQDFSAVRKILNEAVENGEVAGGSVLVLHHGAVVFGEGFGFADMESMTPFKLETPAIVASISKPLLGTAAYRLKKQGKLDLQAPISKYIPEFVNQRLMDGTPLKRMPTTTELFAHTSGVRAMASEGGMPWLAKWTAGKSLEEVVTHYAKEFPFEAQAGVRHAYSGIGTDIAARVLEVAAKRPRNVLFQTEVAKPLGMTSTHYRDALSLKKLSPMPTLYKHGNEDQLEVIRPRRVAPKNGYASSGGSIISSAPDLARWLLMIRNHGRTGDNKRYLDHETINEMLQGVPSSKNSGCGLFIRKRDKHGKAIIVGHSGSTGTNFWLDFQQDVIGIILTQTRDSDIRAFRSNLEKSIYECLNPTR